MQSNPLQNIPFDRRIYVVVWATDDPNKFKSKLISNLDKLPDEERLVMIAYLEIDPQEPEHVLCKDCGFTSRVRREVFYLRGVIFMTRLDSLTTQRLLSRIDTGRSRSGGCACAEKAKDLAGAESSGP